MQDKINLIPKEQAAGYDYLCTWALQEKTAEALKISPPRGTVSQRDALSDETVFGEKSLYHPFSGEYRSGLYFVIDDGWDVPLGSCEPQNDEHSFGLLSPDEEKFPNYGDTYTERLTTLSNKIKEMGYAGLGLWVPTLNPNEPKNNKFTIEQAKKYWIECAKRCRAADIKYLKVDWGNHPEREYREMMTRVFKEYAPGIIIEHAAPQAVFTELTDTKKRAEDTREILPISDVFRLYDVIKPFKNAPMLSRADEALSAAAGAELGTAGILNGEICAPICAALGLSVGIMGEENSSSYAACLRWHRISPPFSIYSAEYKKSEEILTDTHFFAKNAIWWLKPEERCYSEAAPAVMARGCGLPRVFAAGEKPFVAASKNPKTGAYAIASIGRTIDPNVDMIIPADVEFDVGLASEPVGIFGYYKSLTLNFSESIEGKRIFAQDLMADCAVDITDRCRICRGSVRLDGCDLRVFGSYARASEEEDSAEPSLVLAVL